MRLIERISLHKFFAGLIPNFLDNKVSVYNLQPVRVFRRFSNHKVVMYFETLYVM